MVHGQTWGLTQNECRRFGVLSGLKGPWIYTTGIPNSNQVGQRHDPESPAKWRALALLVKKRVIKEGERVPSNVSDFED